MRNEELLGFTGHPKQDSSGWAELGNTGHPKREPESLSYKIEDKENCMVKHVKQGGICLERPRRLNYLPVKTA
jgi:hypothetical protein